MRSRLVYGLRQAASSGLLFASALSLSLSVVMLVVAGFAGAASARADGLMAPTEQAALALARSSGQSVVVMSSLSRTDEVMVNPDGSHSAVVAAGVVREPDPVSVSGWSPVDTSLVMTSSEVVPTRVDVPMSFSDGGSDGFLARLGLGADQVSLDWLRSLPRPTIDGDTATYASVWPGVDVTLRAGVSGFEQSFVVRSRPSSPLVFSIPLGLKGLSARAAADGSIELVDLRSGEVVADSDRARMFDSSVDPVSGDPVSMVGVATSLVMSVSGPVLEVRPDPAFFDRPGLVYPVVVDPPTGTLTPTADTFLQSSWSSGEAADPELRVGTYGTYSRGQDVARSLIQFWTTTTPSWAVNPSTKVLKATLRLYEVWSGGCTPTMFYANNPSVSWAPGTSVHATSAGQPTISGTYAARDAAARDTTYLGSACPAVVTPPCAAPNASVTASEVWTSAHAVDIWSTDPCSSTPSRALGQLVEQWISGSSPNYGVLLSAQNETTDTNSWKKFSSSEGLVPPQLTVAYAAPPSTAPAGLVPANGAKLAASPTFQGVYTAPDSAPYGRLRVAWYAGAACGGAATTLDSVGGATSGTTVTVTPPAALSDGQYSYRAQSVMAYTNSVGQAQSVVGPLSACTAFTVDTVAPSVAVVSGPVFGWVAPSSATTVSWGASRDPLSGAAPAGPYASGVTSYTLWFDGSAVAGSPPSSAVSTTALSQALSFPATSMTAYLHVRASDAAGNVADAPALVAYVGSTGFVSSPRVGDEVARSVVLSATVAPAVARVRYQYRLAPTDVFVDVPPSKVATSTGPIVAGWPVTASSQPLTWDTASTPGLVNQRLQVEVQAVLYDAVSSTPLATTASVSFTLDPAASNAASAAVGPGVVNLETGQYLLSASDVSVGGSGGSLSVSRSFDAFAPGVVGALGTGWQIALPEASQRSLEDTTATWTASMYTAGKQVTITDAAGGKTTYAVQSTTSGGATYRTVAADASLATLVRTDATTPGLAPTFTLTEPDGSFVVFANRAATPVGGSGGIGVVLVAEQSSSRPASANAGSSQTTWTLANGILRPSLYAVTPPGAGSLVCTVASTDVRCRMLTFTYNASGLLSQVSLVAADTAPATAAQVPSPVLVTTPVATYTYAAASSTARLSQVTLNAAGVSVGYTYDAAGRVATVTPSGRLTVSIGYDAVGRVVAVSHPGLVSDWLGGAATVSGTAATTIIYQVPLSVAAGGPYAMSSASVAAWGQSRDVPVVATAIVPQAMAGDPVGAYGTAEVHYLDAGGNETNVASPGGHITTTEYDSYGNVVRSLSAANRERVLAAGTAGASLALQLDAESTYSSDGMRVLESLDPLHSVVVADGSTVQARRHSVYSYAPASAACAAAAGSMSGQLVTQTTVGAQVSGAGADADVRTTTTSYDGQSCLGWTLAAPTLTTTDAAAGGLQLKQATLYDATGRVVAVTQPSAGGVVTTDPRTRVTTYYTATGSAPCGGTTLAAVWAGMVCQVGPGGQITGSTLPALPTRTMTYDRLGGVVSTTQTSGTVSRSSLARYDTAGRVVAAWTSTTGIGTAADAVPATTTSYDALTGAFTTSLQVTNPSLALLGPHGWLPGFVLGSGRAETQDQLGRTVTSTDDAGRMTVTAYDVQDRVTYLNQGGFATQTVYDGRVEPRGLPTQQFGTGSSITAAYDGDGQLTSETFGNGVTRTDTHDAEGAPVGRVVTAPASVCAQVSRCSWMREQARASVHGQWRSRLVSLDNGSAPATYSVGYTYDGAGRLVSTVDSSNSCTAYTYDADANRTLLTVNAVRSDGSCGVQVASQGYAYDQADRLTNAGTVYDALGRMTSVPSVVDASGVSTAALSSTYNAIDHVSSQTVAGVQRSYTTDSSGRYAGWGSASGTTTEHYSGGSDAAAWSTEPGGVAVANVQGLDGALAETASVAGTTIDLASLHGDILATDAVSSDPAVADTLSIGVQYAPTGEPVGVGATGNPASPLPRYGYKGTALRVTDTQSGLVLMGARVYDPQLGRFLSVDPVDGGSASAYDYCNADPVNCEDIAGTSLLGDAARCILHADWGCLKRTFGRWSFYHDACTFAPDGIPGFGDYTDACMQHDLCYGFNEAWATGPRRPRLACDVRLWRGILGACSDDWGTWFLTEACPVIAGVYFRAVRASGWFPYYLSWNNQRVTRHPLPVWWLV